MIISLYYPPRLINNVNCIIIKENTRFCWLLYIMTSLRFCIILYYVDSLHTYYLLHLVIT